MQSWGRGRVPKLLCRPQAILWGGLWLGQGQWVLMVRVLLDHVLTPVSTCLALQ